MRTTKLPSEIELCKRPNVPTIDTQEVASTSKNQKSYNQDATNRLIFLCSKSIFNKSKIMQLIEKGADINGFARENTKHTNGRSPLTILVMHYLLTGHVDYKKLLFSYIQDVIKLGGDPRKTDKLGESAISLARKEGDNWLFSMMIFTKIEVNRLLSKRAFEKQVPGAHGAKDRSVYEDLSTEVTTQLPTEVECRKKPNTNMDVSGVTQPSYCRQDFN